MHAGGRFLMGFDPPIIPRDGEAPRRPVRVSSFYLDRYAVSCTALYALFPRLASNKWSS